jgi:hypothetical protein
MNMMAQTYIKCLSALLLNTCISKKLTIKLFGIFHLHVLISVFLLFKHSLFRFL